MIKIIESKCKSKAAKSPLKPCPHAPRLQIGCLHNCECLRTQEDLFGLQAGNSLCKTNLFLFLRKVWPLPQRMRLSTEVPRVQDCGYPRVYSCTPATQAAPPKTEGQEKPGKWLLQVHSRILVGRKRLWRLSRSLLWPEVCLWKELREVALLYMVCKASPAGWECGFIWMF